MKKEISMISFFLTLILILNIFVPAASAAGDEGLIHVTDASGRPGDEVTVAVRLEKNPGIIAAAMEISYDRARLELIRVTDCKLLKEATFSKTLTDHPYYLSWNEALASCDITQTGDLALLTFQIRPGCVPGETKIAIAYDAEDIFDWDLNNVPFIAKSGTVSVLEEQSQKKTYEDFSDLNPNGWYRDSVEYMLEHNLMKGMDDNRFEPNGLSTRAQFVTILYRAAGAPALSGVPNPFTDVKKDSWYEKSVLWAFSNHVVKGVTDTTFAPEKSITREQLVTLLYRYDGAEPMRENHLLGFRDVSDISVYAKNAMNWAVGSGIVNGVTDTTLCPNDTATRAQIAAMVSRYLKAKTVIEVPTTPGQTK